MWVSGWEGVGDEVDRGSREGGWQGSIRVSGQRDWFVDRSEGNFILILI